MQAGIQTQPVITAVLQGGLNRALRAYQLGVQRQQHRQLLSTSDEGAVTASTDDKGTTKAIISKPLDVVPAEPSTSSGLTSVVLDGSSSTAGATISTAAWSIIKVSDKSNVANANGLVASLAERAAAPGAVSSRLAGAGYSAWQRHSFDSKT
jgi:hypothetical protein